MIILMRGRTKRRKIQLQAVSQPAINRHSHLGRDQYHVFQTQLPGLDVGTLDKCRFKPTPAMGMQHVKLVDVADAGVQRHQLQPAASPSNEA